jgi:folylpolyglutamate synthase/dihydropteroate synthase
MAANPRSKITIVGNLAEAYAQARSEKAEALVITGSLFLVGEALDRLGFTHPTRAKTQKELVLQ